MNTPYYENDYEGDKYRIALEGQIYDQPSIEKFKENIGIVFKDERDLKTMLTMLPQLQEDNEAFGTLLYSGSIRQEENEKQCRLALSRMFVMKLVETLAAAHKAHQSEWEVIHRGTYNLSYEECNRIWKYIEENVCEICKEDLSEGHTRNQPIFLCLKNGRSLLEILSSPISTDSKYPYSALQYISYCINNEWVELVKVLKDQPPPGYPPLINFFCTVYK